MSANHTKLEFYKTKDHGEETIAVLILFRPEHANAFSAQMMEEITFHMGTVSHRAGCRALVITGAGKHFSGGADLNWMQASAKLSYAENIKDSSRLVQMFEAVANLTLPKIAVVRGAVYGGALGLIAACDFAIAHEGAKFCLSEAKLGLLPAVISPYLARKMPPGQLRRHALTGRVFTAQEAKEFSLIECVAGEDQFQQLVETELNFILACGPEAQKAINVLFNKLRHHNFDQIDDTVAAIATARTGREGQAGLAAFFEKKPAPWLTTLPVESIESLKILTGPKT